MAEYISINDLMNILGDNIDGTEDFLVTKNNISYKITLNELDKFLRINEADKLSKLENLNDLENKETARINLEVYSKNETEEIVENNIVELGEKTSGNYVKSVQSGNGIVIEGNIGEGSENTISIQQIGTAGTYTKVQTNEYGQVINNELLTPDDIPNLDASKITSGIIDSSRLPSFVDDVIEVAKYINLPIPGETSKIYIVINDENKNNQTSTYRWTGTLYALVSNNLTALDIKNLYESNNNTNAFTDILLSKLDSIESGAQVNTVTKVSGRVGDVILTKNDVGLSNVKNIDTTNASNITTGTLPLSIFSNTGIAPGEYTKISVDSKGRVILGSKPTNIQDYGITDVYTKTNINTALDSKVDKVVGKQLSTEDYTTAEKNKLSNLSDYIKPASEPISYIDGLQTSLDSKINSYNISNIEYNAGIKRNNKDIYGLEVDLGNLPDTGIKEIPFIFDINYQYWVDTSNSYASDSDEVITLPYGGYIGDDVSVKLDRLNNKIIIITSRDRTSLIGKLIILYTK